MVESLYGIRHMHPNCPSGVGTQLNSTIGRVADRDHGPCTDKGVNIIYRSTAMRRYNLEGAAITANPMQFFSSLTTFLTLTFQF